MKSFFIAVNAVTPFLLYITFGYGIRLSGLVDEAFLKRLNKLIFTAFFPIMMFNNLYKEQHGFKLNIGLVITAILSIFLLQAVSLLVVPRIVKENSRRGVIIQAMYRSNFALFGIPLAASLFGRQGEVLASMMVAIVVPLYNVTAVVILELFRGGQIKAKTLLKNVCTNPPILGAVVGLIFYLLQIKLPSPVVETVSKFANLTTPLALFVLGGTLHFSAIRGNLKYIVPSLFIKMTLLPLIILGVAGLIGFTHVEQFVLFEIFATPVATASYTMAQLMGGDGELAAQFVVLSTAVSVITIFLWVFLLTSRGMIG